MLYAYLIVMSTITMTSICILIAYPAKTYIALTTLIFRR